MGYYFIFSIFWPCHKVCGILVHEKKSDLCPLCWKLSLNHCTFREIWDQSTLVDKIYFTYRQNRKNRHNLFHKRLKRHSMITQFSYPYQNWWRVTHTSLHWDPCWQWDISKSLRKHALTNNIRITANNEQITQSFL